MNKLSCLATKFAGKVAVITGGSTGMGLATAKRFVEEGMDHVFITGRRKDALDKAVAEIGRNVTGVQGDVANLGDLDRLYEAVEKRSRRLDVIFANAGDRTTGAVRQCGREILRTSLRCECEGDLLYRAKGTSAYKRWWVGHSHGVDC
jgi:NAD(P)-dependent dehydrogenase (short-subunit alcohol dehydrogenase family)